MSQIRIQKAMSAAGVASRRAVEQMVLEGRVAVNGKLVARLPCFVDPARDRIEVDGRPVGRRSRQRTYILLNKPRGVVCTRQEDPGRPCVTDMVADLPRAVRCVGRLEMDSAGLVLLTDDGQLEQHLTHARYQAPKTEVVEIEGRLEEAQIATLKTGMFIDGRRTGRSAVRVLRSSPTRSLLEIRIVASHNRQVRRMLETLGHKVRRIKRVAIGPVTDEGLKVGHYRRLRPGEVARLLKGAENR
jgi:pseudouridine synthase